MNQDDDTPADEPAWRTQSVTGEIQVINQRPWWQVWRPQEYSVGLTAGPTATTSVVGKHDPAFGRELITLRMILEFDNGETWSIDTIAPPDPPGGGLLGRQRKTYKTYERMITLTSSAAGQLLAARIDDMLIVAETPTGDRWVLGEDSPGYQGRDIRPSGQDKAVATVSRKRILATEPTPFPCLLLAWRLCWPDYTHPSSGGAAG